MVEQISARGSSEVYSLHVAEAGGAALFKMYRAESADPMFEVPEPVMAQAIAQGTPYIPQIFAALGMANEASSTADQSLAGGFRGIVGQIKTEHGVANLEAPEGDGPFVLRIRFAKRGERRSTEKFEILASLISAAVAAGKSPLRGAFDLLPDAVSALVNTDLALMAESEAQVLADAIGGRAIKIISRPKGGL